MKKKQLLIRLHPNKHKALKVLAANKGLSINCVVEFAISILTATPEKFFHENKEEK